MRLCLYIGVHFWGVLTITALLYVGVCIRTPEFWNPRIPTYLSVNLDGEEPFNATLTGSCMGPSCKDSSWMALTKGPWFGLYTTFNYCRGLNAITITDTKAPCSQ